MIVRDALEEVLRDHSAAWSAEDRRIAERVVAMSIEIAAAMAAGSDVSRRSEILRAAALGLSSVAQSRASLVIRATVERLLLGLVGRVTGGLFGGPPASG